MTRSKKTLIIITSLLLLSQIPFAYRRYRLGRLNAAILMVNSHGRLDERDPFVEYKGVIHVHSFLGGHSTGTFQEIIAAAQANQLQFVIMTEHAENEIDTSAMTLKDIHGGVLFVNGNEVKTSTGDRLLTIPGDGSLSGSEKLSTENILGNARTRGALSIVAYPDEFKSWGNAYDALEIYNVFTNSRKINPVLAFFDVLWSHHSYPDLLFGNYYTRPTDTMKKWDELLAHGKVAAMAGNDAHANIGISLNDSGGNELMGLQLDPYRTSFHLVRMHVLLPRGKALETRSLLEALHKGHCFIGFDLFGDTSGFRFEAGNAGASAIQGDELPLTKETRLKVTLPVSSRLLLLKNGEVLVDETGINEKEMAVTERGVYRVEVYLPQLGKPVGEQPWIISNPIYVR